MKSTGIVRRMDHLGRIVIPMELRRTLGIAENDAIEIYVDGEHIVLKKYDPGCTVCGDVEATLHSLTPDKQLCHSCMKAVAKEWSKLLPGQVVQ